jgi:hypothetical protein
MKKLELSQWMINRTGHLFRRWTYGKVLLAVGINSDYTVKWHVVFEGDLFKN